MATGNSASRLLVRRATSTLHEVKRIVSYAPTSSRSRILARRTPTAPHPGLDRALRPMAMTHDAVAAIRQRLAFEIGKINDIGSRLVRRKEPRRCRRLAHPLRRFDAGHDLGKGPQCVMALVRRSMTNSCSFGLCEMARTLRSSRAWASSTRPTRGAGRGHGRAR